MHLFGLLTPKIFAGVTWNLSRKLVRRGKKMNLKRGGMGMIEMHNKYTPGKTSYLTRRIIAPVIQGNGGGVTAHINRISDLYIQEYRG